MHKYGKICHSLYFPTGYHDLIDIIIGNGYLSYMFSEHANISNLQEYKEFGYLCRNNLRNALLRMPLLLKPSTESIAALTIAVGFPSREAT